MGGPIAKELRVGALRQPVKEGKRPENKEIKKPKGKENKRRDSNKGKK